jgi:hypothetical protein
MDANEEHIAWMMMHAVYYEPVHAVIRRRGKIYDMWASKRTRRKIISREKLMGMSIAEFVEWLQERSPIARTLFPDARVYQERTIEANECGLREVGGCE